MRFKEMEREETRREEARLSEPEEGLSVRPLGEEEEDSFAAMESTSSGKPSLPLEWAELSEQIEAQRSRTPVEGYTESFIERLRPRLRDSLIEKEAVRNWLNQTFWPRWTVRAAATAVILLLLSVAYQQRGEIGFLKGQVSDLTTEINTLKAGM